jgi:hypothetical protein
MRCVAFSASWRDFGCDASWMLNWSSTAHLDVVLLPITGWLCARCETQAGSVPNQAHVAEDRHASPCLSFILILLEIFIAGFLMPASGACLQSVILRTSGEHLCLLFLQTRVFWFCVEQKHA